MVKDMIMFGDMIYCNVRTTPNFMTSMGSPILNLKVASEKVAVKIGEWRMFKHMITSDHRLITFDYEVVNEKKKESRINRFKIRKDDWDVFRQKLAKRLFDGQLI